MRGMVGLGIYIPRTTSPNPECLHMMTVQLQLSRVTVVEDAR